MMSLYESLKEMVKNWGMSKNEIDEVNTKLGKEGIKPVEEGRQPETNIYELGWSEGKEDGYRVALTKMVEGMKYENDILCDRRDSFREAGAKHIAEQLDWVINQRPTNAQLDELIKGG